jgi:hypothetical protein
MGHVDRDDSRVEVLGHEADHGVPVVEVDRLRHGMRAVPGADVGGEAVAELLPRLEIQGAEVAVLEALDLFDRFEVHGESLERVLAPRYGVAMSEARA